MVLIGIVSALYGIVLFYIVALILDEGSRSPGSLIWKYG